MRVFLTGATGFIGSFLVPELLDARHHVVGLTRSDAGAEALARIGAQVFRGDLNDPQALRGTGLVRRSKTRAPVTETDDHLTSAEYARAATEEAADALIAEGMHVMVLRLPQAHDARRQGRLTHHIRLARQHGRVAYVGDGENRLAAVHVSDAVRVFRLALERGEPGARYHAVGEEGVTLRDIAEVIGAGLKLPVASITSDEAPGYFGPLASLAVMDLAASSVLTREKLGWKATGPDLLTDLRKMDSGMGGSGFDPSGQDAGVPLSVAIAMGGAPAPGVIAVCRDAR